MKRWIPIVLAALGVLAGTATAHAGGPGTWTQVTGIGGPARNTDEIGVARTADGVLHVAWTHAESGSYNDLLLHSAIAANGLAVSAPNPILAGFEINNSVDLLTAPDNTLRVFFAGLKPNHPLDTLLATATAPASGAAWTVQPTPASRSVPGENHPVYVAGGIGGGLAPGGIPIGAWGDSSPGGGAYNVGLNEAVPDGAFSPLCCDGGPDVATGTDGQVVLARYFLGDSAFIIARLLPSGQELIAPGSGAVQLQERVSVSGRSSGPGVYIAYSSGTNPFLGVPAIWRVGAPQATVLSSVTGAEHTQLAAAPGGRMWVFWEDDNQIYARRSNGAVTVFGAAVKVAPPPNTSTIYRLIGEGSGGPLDVLALIDAGGTIAFRHQRVLAGLTVTAKPTKLNGKKGGKVTLKVTDAGDPIAGASVALKLGAKTLKGKTGAAGTVKLTIPKKSKRGTRSASATKLGYTAGKTTIKIT